MTYQIKQIKCDLRKRTDTMTEHAHSSVDSSTRHQKTSLSLSFIIDYPLWQFGQNLGENEGENQKYQLLSNHTF